MTQPGQGQEKTDGKNRVDLQALRPVWAASSQEHLRRLRTRGLSWVYVVDVAPAGFSRRQKKVGGFTTRKAAQAAMFETIAASRLARESAAELTIGRYLKEWLAAAAAGGSIRPTTAKAYEVALRVHVEPTLGRVGLQSLSRRMIKDLYDHL